MARGFEVTQIKFANQHLHPLGSCFGLVVLTACDFSTISTGTFAFLGTYRAIDHFKVTAAMLPGVQIFWGERAARHKLQMVD